MNIFQGSDPVSPPPPPGPYRQFLPVVSANECS
jgi:hypothetical protein